MKFDASVFEKIHQGFSFLDEDEPLTILNHDPDNSDKSDGMGEYPLRGCLHPAYALPFG
jgi:hypothetical protein